jgi:hypothetical protein
MIEPSIVNPTPNRPLGGVPFLRSLYPRQMSGMGRTMADRQRTERTSGKLFAGHPGAPPRRVSIGAQDGVAPSTGAPLTLLGSARRCRRLPDHRSD